jgi:hypothetical protein
LKVRKLAYRVALPSDLAKMHDIFHVSMLRKYFPNPDLVVEYLPLEIQEELIYKECMDSGSQGTIVGTSRRFLSLRCYGATIESKKHHGKWSGT